MLKLILYFITWKKNSTEKGNTFYSVQCTSEVHSASEMSLYFSSALKKEAL